MAKRTTRIWLDEDVAREFRRRAKILGLTHNEFMKMLLAEQNGKESKAYKEIMKILDMISKKIDDVTFVVASELAKRVCTVPPSPPDKQGFDRYATK